MSIALACTVRGCGLVLTRHDRTLRCANGHSYDVARSGYVNLLQPQDRRSLDAGDSKDVVAARARLIAAGIGRALIDAMVSTAASLDLGESPVAIELGSGTGDLLAALARTRPIAAIGIDLSTAAAGHAARRHPELTWVVANADRRLPVLDGSASLVLSMHARRNPDECARILSPGGFLLVAVPGPDDLIELRASVQGEGVERDRVATLVAEHARHFTPAGHTSVRGQQHLDREALRDLLRISYRGARESAAARVDALRPMDVTFASDLVLFRRGEADYTSP